MVRGFTKRNHYNPCFWTALWNRQYFEDWAAKGQTKRVAREQSVFALNLRANNVLRSNVDNLHYDKNLGVAEIKPDSMKSFCRRWFPQEYDRLSEYVDKNPETLIMDFEGTLSGMEKLQSYTALMQAVRIGGLESAEHKGFLVGALIIHSMRSHAFMTSMLDHFAKMGMEKWEYFWILKNAWSNRWLLARAALPMAMGQWIFYRTDDHHFPLCDLPVMIQQDTVMAILSPKLLLEINLNVPQPEDRWLVRQGISSSKYREFRRRAIDNTFKEIIFSERATLEDWRSLPECRRRVAQLNHADGRVQCLREATSRIVWALQGFGRVPDDFESWGNSLFPDPEKDNPGLVE